VPCFLVQVIRAVFLALKLLQKEMRDAMLLLVAEYANVNVNVTEGDVVGQLNSSPRRKIITKRGRQTP
jgi:hypothetical protein